MLSRLAITFLPRSKSLLISWLQSPSAVILEPRKIKSDTVSTVSPSISCREPAYCMLSAALSTASSFRIAGGQCEELRPWQGSWGGRLGMRGGGIELQESPWKFSSTYPWDQGLPTFCFGLSPAPLTLRGAVPRCLSLKKELACSSG